jgi:hypothetical protein
MAQDCQYPGNMLIDQTPGVGRDINGGAWRVVTAPEVGVATLAAVQLADSARTTNGTSISGTLTHAAGKLVYVRGFRITAAPIAIAVTGQVTLTGLVSGKTFTYELAALVGSIAQIFEDFGDTGVAANDGSTDIVLTVPALTLATISLNIWGHRI